MIWILTLDSSYTNYSFLSKKEEEKFENSILIQFNNGNLIAPFWSSLYLRRMEPKKHPDFFEIADSGIIAISQRAVTFLETELKGAVELLPIETDAGRFYAMNILKVVDCLNRNESKYESTKGGTIVSYSLLEFDKNKIGENQIFKIPEMPYCVFITNDFWKSCRDKNLRGLLFDTDTNLVWYPE